jgi:hypothetical protein
VESEHVAQTSRGSSPSVRGRRPGIIAVDGTRILTGLREADKWVPARQFGHTTGVESGLTSPRLHVIPGDEAPWARRQPR